ncbi:ribonuclease Y [Patescibacteria group bacterium]|nr:ribonuclease Y [Patescibacteria group bacterium]MBU4162384.1 ribonuclease Y [Patescibacteria group bacterium]
MNQLTLLIVGLVGAVIGAILGYLTRQSIAKKQLGSIELKIQNKITQAKKDADTVLSQSENKASEIIKKARTEEELRKRELLKTERFILQRETALQTKITDLDEKEKLIYRKADEIKELKEKLQELIDQEIGKLESIAHLERDDAKKELLERIEKEAQKEMLERMMRLERDGSEKLKERAKEIVALAIQRCALPQAQDTTTTTVNLPSDKIKGRIIGKEGRNIKAFEKATGVEVVVDETPEAITISGFNPYRRYIAKRAMERLIEDGRIQPARIEEIVARVEEEVVEQVKQAGDTAVYETGILDLDPKLVELLGRLRFRTSFGQNVLLHSVEVSLLSGMLAEEIGADVRVARKAGLLHDIGKAMDHQVQGSHTDIGIKILEKFGIEKEVITAMKSHHEEYPYETVESHIVQAADQISGARPGARKDTLENYLKRLGDLENIANSFEGVEKSYAIQAGRELRVFVKPDEIDDLAGQRLARDIAKRISEELKYPGEIKVVLIREKRITEYAK